MTKADIIEQIYEKVGFSREGLLREEYMRDGVYRDMVRMSILEHEFGGAQ